MSEAAQPDIEQHQELGDNLKDISSRLSLVSASLKCWYEKKKIPEVKQLDNALKMVQSVQSSLHHKMMAENSDQETSESKLLPIYMGTTRSK